MSETNDFGAGWNMTPLGVGSRKAHYYSAGFSGSSLCGKYTLLGGIREDHTHYSPDNCTECMRRYFAQHPELDLPRHLRRVKVEVVADVKEPEYGFVYVAAGTRGTVHGLSAESLTRLASQGGYADLDVSRPRRRRISVRADNLRVLA